jgi:uncharacterized tellurite resistance protein B-like protein
MGSSTPTKLNPQEAFIGILLSVIAADGHISEQEIDDFNGAVRKAKILQGMSSQQFNSSCDKTFGIMQKQGIDKFYDLAIPALPEECYKGTFTIACDLVFSDGTIEEDEEATIENLKTRLGIDDETAQLTIYVVNNKYSV